MESNYVLLLSLIVFLPAAGALVLTFFPREKTQAMKFFSLGITVAVFMLTVIMLLPGVGGDARFEPGVAQMQKLFSVEWIPTFRINYIMGIDGVSFPLVVL